MSTSFAFALGMIVMAGSISASIYWSPYQSCVRSQINDSQYPATESDANLACAKLIKSN